MATRIRIGLRQIRAMQPKQIIWDASVSGFGARRQNSDAVAYILFYRTREGRQRWHTIGRHGAPWTPESAREEAKRLLGKVSAGEDPSASKKSARNFETVAALCDQYLADAKAGRLLTRGSPKKLSTLVTDSGRIERHIKPLLGTLSVSAVTHEDIERFMHAVAEGKTAARVKTRSRGLANVRGGKGAATRTVGLLGAIFSYAVRRRSRVDNPVRGVVRFADGRRERRLSDDEYGLLGDALRQAKRNGIWPPAVDAVRFLAITGWRTGEVLGLKWTELDLGRQTAVLPDTKTGRSLRPLSKLATELIANIAKSSDLVFPSSRGEVQMTGLSKMFRRIAKVTNIADDVTPHVLRHSFSSLAGDLGYSEPTIAALIGHKGQTITHRYIHAADAVLIAAAQTVSARTSELMKDIPERVVPIRRSA